MRLIEQGIAQREMTSPFVPASNVLKWFFEHLKDNPQLVNSSRSK